MTDLGHERRGEVAVLTLNRPEKLNALTHALVDELQAALEDLAADTTIRAIVITGAGRGFCAGADLGGGPSDTEAVLREHYHPLVKTLRGLPVPVIAAVNGVAAGAGLSVALACDFRVAGESASFNLPFVRVGLIPDAGALWLLPRLIGTARATQLAMTADKLTAADALSWGLVGQLAPDDAVLEAAMALADRLAGRAGSALAATKHALDVALDSSFDELLDLEATLQGEAQRSPEFAAARAKFGGRAA